MIRRDTTRLFKKRRDTTFLNQYNIKQTEMALWKLDERNISEFLASFDTVLIDCDGVLWNGPDVIPGSPETLAQLRELGKKIFYVTNNSTKTREVYVNKCRKLGYAAEKDDIIGTAYVLAQYLKHTIKYDGKVYLVGSKGLAGELDNVGIPHTGLGDGATEEDVDEQYIVDMELDPEIKCVVVGFDFGINYLKLAKAACYLGQPGCRFFATNTDAVLPLAGGKSSPGTGAILAAVEVAGGRKPEAIMGKPHRPMFDMIQQMHDIDPTRTIMIGDRLNTDIEFGKNSELAATVMVLTGVSTLEEARKYQSSNSLAHQKMVPDHYVHSLGDLKPLIEKVVSSSSWC